MPIGYLPVSNSACMPQGTQTRTFAYTGADMTSATNPENGTVTYQYDGAHHERRLANHGGVGWRACGAGEVHAQVAMSVIVSTLTEAVGRIGPQRYDQRNSRDKRDQTNTEETRAQGRGATCQGTNKRSL